jgi:hypothetical protein
MKADTAFPRVEIAGRESTLHVDDYLGHSE